MTRYVVIDFETTGLSPKHGDRAIEVGAVVIEDGTIKQSYQSLINPNIPVSEYITDLTGITDKEVRKAPPPKKVFTQLSRLVKGATIVAHNASFDRRFWQSELSAHCLDDSHQFLCTMLIARRLYPWSSNHRLQTLVELHNITTKGNYHRALADASMTADLFIHMQYEMGKLYPEEPITEDFLARYQKMKKANARSSPERLGQVSSAVQRQGRDKLASEPIYDDRKIEGEHEKRSLLQSKYVWLVVILIAGLWVLSR